MKGRTGSESRIPMATLRKIPKDIDDYLNRFSGETRLRLEQVRSAIRKAAPDATETISYGIPAFKSRGSTVWFAGYKHHVGFYPGAAAITEFKEELSGYKGAKGSVQFPHAEPFPTQLVGQIVKFRMKQTRKTKKKG